MDGPHSSRSTIRWFHLMFVQGWWKILDDDLFNINLSRMFLLYIVLLQVETSNNLYIGLPKVCCSMVWKKVVAFKIGCLMSFTNYVLKIIMFKKEFIYINIFMLPFSFLLLYSTDLELLDMSLKTPLRLEAKLQLLLVKLAPH